MQETRVKEKKLKGYGWWSHSTCFSCGYGLKRDEDNLIRSGEWQQQTGCPSCYKSFVS